MKYDKLERLSADADEFGNVVLNCNEGGNLYNTDEVDEAIAELKEKLRFAEMAKDDAELANTEYREDIRKLKAENDRLDDLAHAHNLELLQKENIIAEMKAENERLVKCSNEYDSRQRIDETIKFNAAQSLRKMKRTLWIARAESAKFWAQYWFDVAPLKHIKYDRIGRLEGVEKEAILTKVTKHMTASDWVGLWENVERKCRAKAEEYK